MNPEGIFGSHLPEYVILHALWMESKGQEPCIGWNNITDPDTALTAALNEVNSGHPYLISLVQSQPHEVIELARTLENHPRLQQAKIYLEVSVDAIFCLIDFTEVPEIDIDNWSLYYEAGTRPCDGKLERAEIPWISQRGERSNDPVIKIFCSVSPQTRVSFGGA